MSQLTEYGTNWSNIDLSSAYERNLNILEPYDFETLLLELSCNIKTSELTEEAILRQFNESLDSKVQLAKEIIKDNLKNVLKYELDQRED